MLYVIGKVILPEMGVTIPQALNIVVEMLWYLVGRSGHISMLHTHLVTMVG